MREMIKMIVVLTVLSVFSGGLLAAINNSTKEQVKFQQLTYVQGPALKQIFEKASNDPIKDRFKIKDGAIERTIFVGIVDGSPDTLAFESFGMGYGGKLGVMVAVNLKTDKIFGLRVTTNLETPGVGSRAITDLTFVSQFSGLSINNIFKVKADGGQVSAMSGATLTSRGVSQATTAANIIYRRIKPQLVEKLKLFIKKGA